MLDVHPLGVHDLLDDVGPHLLLALSVFVAGLAGILLLLLALRAAGILRQLFLVDTQLQCTHTDGELGEVAPAQAGAPMALTLTCLMYGASVSNTAAVPNN